LALTVSMAVRFTIWPISLACSVSAIIWACTYSQVLPHHFAHVSGARDVPLRSRRGRTSSRLRARSEFSKVPRARSKLAPDIEAHLLWNLETVTRVCGHRHLPVWVFSPG
jgi:hypothetical protein